MPIRNMRRMYRDISDICRTMRIFASIRIGKYIHMANPNFYRLSIIMVNYTVYTDKYRNNINILYLKHRWEHLCPMVLRLFGVNRLMIIINCNFSGSAKRLQFMICQLIGNHPDRESHHLHCMGQDFFFR